MAVCAHFSIYSIYIYIFFTFFLLSIKVIVGGILIARLEQWTTYEWVRAIREIYMYIRSEEVRLRWLFARSMEHEMTLIVL